jgi:lipopolysaccharide export system permease protein
VKILNRYVLREHVGPFLFAVTALTSLMLLQYIARRFGDLVGKGIGWDVILEFFMLSIPFTVAMTLPMAVLVAVLYAFSRLGAENEVTALKAGGVSSRSLLNTVLVAATGLALGMVLFNDQVMPWANHRLATLQLNIAVTKPTFALRAQVINEVQPERLLLRAGSIDPATSKLHAVTIDDIADPFRRRTIIADSGRIALAENHKDVVLTLYDGYMLSMPTQKRGELDRLYFDTQLIRLRDVAGQFKQTEASQNMKGDREMNVCEMQREFERASANYHRASLGLATVLWRAGGSKGPEPKPTKPQPARGLGFYYCQLYTWAKGVVSGPKEAQANGLRVPGSGLRVPGSGLRVPGSGLRVPASGLPVEQPATSYQQPATRNPYNIDYSEPIDVTIQRTELEAARKSRDRMGIEIHKKFSLAATCVVFALLGAPLALRFPRGGIGMVIGVSFGIFALSYVGLIGGESLSNKGYIRPEVGMWTANAIFTAIGIILYARMGHEASSSRGGDVREWLENLRLKLRGRSPIEASP